VYASRNPSVKAARAAKKPLVRASQRPIVKQDQGSSYVRFEIGNYQFLDDMTVQRETQTQPEEEAAMNLNARFSLKMLTIFASIAYLFT